MLIARHTHIWEHCAHAGRFAIRRPRTVSVLWTHRIIFAAAGLTKSGIGLAYANGGAVRGGAVQAGHAGVSAVDAGLALGRKGGAAGIAAEKSVGAVLGVE